MRAQGPQPHSSRQPSFPIELPRSFRGGERPDLAGKAPPRVRAPTLLIAGGADFGFVELNREAFTRLRGPKALETAPEATHLFPEPGAMDAIIGYAAKWF